MKRLVLIISFTTILQQFLFSQQIKKFSADTTLYIKEIQTFAGTGVQTQDEAAFKGFVAAFSGDSVWSYQEKMDIIELSNLFLQKKARLNPYFIDLFKCLLVFNEKAYDKQNYYVWLDGFKKLIIANRAKLSNMDDILTGTCNLLQNNYLEASASHMWKGDKANYKFVSDSDLWVVFTDIDLSCNAKKDSIIIYGTHGRYNFIDKRWYGEGGKVNWERSGFKETEVNAVLKTYTIDLNRLEYTADSVIFTNTYYFKEPVPGILRDKVEYIADSTRADYPQFDSYQKDFFIKNLYENIDYDGGLSIEGSKMIGRGGPDNPATIQIYRNDTLVLTARSIYFAFKKDKVNSLRTEIVLHLDNDSIFHPDLSFNFSTTNRELSLLKNEEYTSKGPFYDSYHKMDFNCEQLIWPIDEADIRLTMSRGSSIGEANFRSINFFNQYDYDRLQLMDPIHPLVSLKSFAKKIGSDEFLVSDYADYMKMNIESVRHMLMRMSYEGFVFYDVNNETITIKQRLYDYIAASVGRIDYDVMNFNSVTNAPLENAIFNTNNFDMTINGIESVYLSDSQFVVITPRNNQIIMKQNRNFQFSGTVDAGLFSFYGDNFVFSYDSFKIQLINIDSLQIRYVDDVQVDRYGNPLVVNVDTKIENLTGDLWIDAPNNKSGFLDYPQYPIFSSKEASYIYYDDPYIEGGVYTRDNFYFELDSFSIDSLDNFNKELLRYDGVLYSAGILPIMEQTLTIQDDNSLGFIINTKPEGLPAYGNKGRYFAQLSLDKKGLRGAGKLNYITSTTLSQDFKFYPDSMNTDAMEHKVAQRTTEIQFPSASIQGSYIHWMPYEEVMYTYQKETPFKMFNDTTFLYGNLELRPSGLFGKSKMDLKNSVFYSSLFRYKANEIFADTANFQIRSLHSENFTILAENVNIHVDYRIRQGEFKSNEEFSLVEFPENKYISYLDYFVWNMDRKELAMGLQKKTGTQKSTTAITTEDSLVGPRYVSVHPHQDSLSFVSPKAVYNYKDNIITASEVPYILVADAKIFPNKGKVVVEEDANMRRLDTAKIETNQLTKYHKFFNATIKIAGRYNYSGNGDYNYVDELEDIQKIHFSSITVDTTHQTIASGTILEPQDFTLSPNYVYQGKVKLLADRRFLEFDGALKVEHNCNNIANGWLAFDTVIDPLNIYIPIPEQCKDINMQKIYKGIMVANDSIHLYSTFFDPRKSYNDSYLVTSSGYLYYDKTSGLYKIASKERLANVDLAEDYLSFNREVCELYGEGEINLGADFGQLKVKTYGSAMRKHEQNSTRFNLVMALDFFMHEEVVKIMAAEIDSFAGLAGLDVNDRMLNKAISNSVGIDEAFQLKDELSLTGEYKTFPKELEHTLLLSNINFEWNDNTNSYRYKGKIGIVSIGSTQVFKMVDGIIEMQKKRSGDLFDLMLKLDNNTWYYFSYTRGVMMTQSSNRAYDDLLVAMDPDKRQLNVPSGETSYIYMIATELRKSKFISRFQEEFNEESGEESLESIEQVPETEMQYEPEPEIQMEQQQQETEPKPENQTEQQQTEPVLQEEPEPELDPELEKYLNDPEQ